MLLYIMYDSKHNLHFLLVLKYWCNTVRANLAIIPVVIHPIVLGITVAYPIIQRLSFCNSMLRKRCTTFSSSNVYHRVTLILS